jgi:hypothetical protein
MSGKYRTWTLGDWQRKPGVRMPSKDARQIVERVEGEFFPPVRVAEAETVAEEMEGVHEFLSRVEKWSGSDPDELAELQDSIEALLRVLRPEGQA